MSGIVDWRAHTMGPVARVQFVVDGTVIATATREPWATTWTPTPGPHRLEVRASTRDGGSPARARPSRAKPHHRCVCDHRSPAASIEHPTSRRNRLVLVACILGSIIVFVDSTVVNVALPAIQRDLGGGLALQQWVVDAYLLTLGSLLLVGGSLGDLFGARRVFMIGIAAFGITSLLCAGAPDGTTLILARGLQGVAGARAHAGRPGRDRDDVQRRGARRRDRHLDRVDGHRVRRSARSSAAGSSRTRRGAGSS